MATPIRLAKIAVVSTSTLDEPPAVQADAVRRWRLEQLEAAGYPPRDAHVLSERTDVDLHVAAGLLRQGCRVDTALRILL